MALATPMLGDLIAGGYRVEAELGRGGMGVVLRAHDTRLNRIVAVKMLAAEAVQSKLLRQRLASEARIASALNHPGIATVYDFIELDEAAFIIYEFVPGRTLRRHLESERFSETLDAALQLTEALAAAHDNSITHRDLKPENIMVTQELTHTLTGLGATQLTINYQEPAPRSLPNHISSDGDEGHHTSRTILRLLHRQFDRLLNELTFPSVHHQRPAPQA